MDTITNKQKQPPSDQELRTMLMVMAKKEINKKKCLSFFLKLIEDQLT